MKTPGSTWLRRGAYLFLTLLCLLLLTGAFAWWSLKKGIELDHLSLASVEMTRLSLRLDNGLILRLGQLSIPERKSSGRDISLERLVPRIRKWGHLIREVDIDRLSVKDQIVGIIYRNGRFQVRGDMFTMDATITYEKDAFRADLIRLVVPPYDVTLSGKASYTRSRDTFHFTGTFSAPQGTGALSVTEKDGQVDARVSTVAFTDLVGILARFNLDQDLLDWLSENISAGSYQVTQLRIQSPLKDLTSIGPDNVSGTAVATAADIRFHPDLPPVKSEKIHISYQADRLSFELEKPTYRGINLNGSKVYIDHLTGDDSQLVITIKTETRLQKEVVELLAKYDVTFPARQETGTTRADLRLAFALPRFTLETKGLFTAGPGAWQWGEIPVQTRGITVQLQNNLVTLQETELSYQDILRVHLSGSMDTAEHHAELQGDVMYLNLEAGDMALLQAAGIQVPLHINFAGSRVQVRLSEQDTTITFEDGATTVDIKSLAAISPLVPLLRKIKFSEGNALLSMQDMDTINFSGSIAIPNTVLSLQGTPVTRFTFEGVRSPGRTDISVNEKRIIASLTDRLTVSLHDYLVTVDTGPFKKMDDPRSIPVPMEITGPAINLLVKGFLIPGRKFRFMAGEPEISLGTQLEKGHLLFENTGGKIHITGTDLDGKIAEPFIHFADFSGGTIDFTLEGTADNYTGYLEFNNVLMKDYLVMNNVIAFLNSIPALATLSSPGFDEGGYRVKEGLASFEVNGKLLTIRRLRADGSTVNCEAQGWVNFADRTLDVDLELITMKDYSYLINKVPLAGYAILGEDGTLSTSLKIKGSLDAPSIKTFLARDITMTPFNVIKRTLEWPFRMLKRANGKK